MRATFAACWRYARQVTAWSKVMLTGPPHVWDLFRPAEHHQETAAPFSDPTGLIDRFLHPERASAFLDSVRRTHPAAGGHLALRAGSGRRAPSPRSDPGGNRAGATV